MPTGNVGSNPAPRIKQQQEMSLDADRQRWFESCPRIVKQHHDENFTAGKPGECESCPLTIRTPTHELGLLTKPVCS